MSGVMQGTWHIDGFLSWRAARNHGPSARLRIMGRSQGVNRLGLTTDPELAAHRCRLHAHRYFISGVGFFVTSGASEMPASTWPSWGE